MFFCKKKIGSRKLLGQKKNLTQKKIWVNFFSGVKKMFWSENFFGQKFWVKKTFQVTHFGQKNMFFFGQKNQVGLTQGGGYMTPPQKIVGLKLCWVVVSFAR